MPACARSPVRPGRRGTHAQRTTRRRTRPRGKHQPRDRRSCCSSPRRPSKYTSARPTKSSESARARISRTCFPLRLRHSPARIGVRFWGIPPMTRGRFPANIRRIREIDPSSPHQTPSRRSPQMHVFAAPSPSRQNTGRRAPRSVVVIALLTTVLALAAAAFAAPANAAACKPGPIAWKFNGKSVCLKTAKLPSNPPRADARRRSRRG